MHCVPSPQIEWNRNQLESLPASVRFVFFILHHPPVVDVQPNFDASHNGRPNERALAEFLARAPQKSRARFVVAAGQVHLYGFKPRNAASEGLFLLSKVGW